MADKSLRADKISDARESTRVHTTDARAERRGHDRHTAGANTTGAHQAVTAHTNAQGQGNDTDKRSNMESLGMQHGNDNVDGPTYSGYGKTGSSLVLFLITFLLFAFGIYALGWYPGGGWLGWIIALVCMIAPWFIIFHLTSSKTNRAPRKTSTELTQL